ncbi:uncharacterized protein LOC127522381 [Ctenopharyngodon idella]|uniref:uncharacterized protein LOC127522381 n=1 Tax=Ctenopharyngodon idella TaxID=7959 RepID=UPI00222F1CEB|nr:uncharacterized protein LOC127522381 [Ctenopharyngodon idella]
MELFIFIAFQLLIEVQSHSSLQKPFISYNSDDVQPIISCEIPLPVRADFTCSLYTEDDLLHSQKRQSGERLCMFYVTPGELFTRSENRQLSCDYSLNTEPEIRSPCSETYTIRGQKSSPHSDPVPVTVQSSTTTTTARTITTATTSNIHFMLNLITSKAKETMFSIVTSTLPDIRSMSGHVSTETSTQKTSQTKTEISTTAVSSTTETPTSTRTAVSSVHTSTTGPNDHPLTPLHRETWFIVLVSTGVGVILTGFICLCRFASKKRRKHNKMISIRSDVPIQEIGMSSGPAETYSVITSVPATSQPISVGLEHPDSHQDNTPDPTATSSFIMSENSIYQPSEDLVNTQQKQGNTEENEDVYHLYCTIPDKPVHSNAADQVYSLVKMH